MDYTFHLDFCLSFKQVDKHESARAMKKAELLENLKRLFPGVVSTDQWLSQVRLPSSDKDQMYFSVGLWIDVA